MKDHELDNHQILLFIFKSFLCFPLLEGNCSIRFVDFISSARNTLFQFTCSGLLPIPALSASSAGGFVSLFPLDSLVVCPSRLYCELQVPLYTGGSI